MKKKIIRSGVFETNSSSAHSVSIADNTKPFILDTIYPDENGVIKLTGGEFGWDWFKENDALEKANYVAQQFAYDSDAQELLIDIILEMTGADNVEICNLEDGYVDHDSVGIIPQDREVLRQFIFNKNSWLFGGNDNGTPDPTFYDVPEYTVNGIEEVVYNYSLSIDGFEGKTYFKNKPTTEEINSAINSLIDDVYVDVNGTFDTETSIYHRINIDRSKQFKLSYRVKTDHKKKLIPFLRQDTWEAARKLFDENSASKTVEWSKDGYRMVREIEDGLVNLPNSPYVMWKSYKIKKIGKADTNK